MTGDAPLDPFQDQVARIALAAAESWSFALAGGNALVAHGLLVRPTEDVDLFSAASSRVFSTSLVTGALTRPSG